MRTFPLALIPVMKTKSFLRHLAVLLFAFAFSVSAQAAPKNVDNTGKALQGYDPVAFFTDKKPVKGQPTIHSTVGGAKYYFATEEHKKMFDKSPSKYEPAYGGWCAWGVVKGDKVKIDPNAFQIANGRLLLQYNNSVRNTFNKDIQGNVKKADANWPEVSKK